VAREAGDDGLFGHRHSKGRQSDMYSSSRLSLARPTAAIRPARVISTVLLATAIATALAGCASTKTKSTNLASTSTTPAAATSAPTSTSPSTTSAASALDRWNQAYSYLSTQTKPTEIVCSWFINAGATPSPAPKPSQFYDFTDPAPWKKHLITRNDPLPK